MDKICVLFIAMFPNRVARNRVLYFLVWGFLLAGFAYLLTNYSLNFHQLIVLALVAVLPSRIVAHFWKDFFYGKRLLRRRMWTGAAICFEHFLKEIESSPWLKWLMFFSYGLYSFKVEAVALTYLAVARLHEKRWEDAAICLSRALEVDTRYAPALYYGAALAALQEQEEEAAVRWARAVEHGFPKLSIEEFRNRVASEFA